jgi:hypothetical protein
MATFERTRRQVMLDQPGMVLHTCNPSTREWGQEDSEFQDKEGGGGVDESHCAYGETEARRGEMIFLSSHSEWHRRDGPSAGTSPSI